MFHPTTSLLEIVARVVIVYAGLAVLIRLTGKKELGQLAPMDFLTMLIVSETIAPALTAQDPSITSGLVAAATLMSLTFVLDWLAFRSSAVARLLHGRAKVLIEDGKVLSDVQRGEHMTRHEIDAAVRREGVERIEKVKLAYVETTGRISVIPMDD
jgi:uncharacterized membrane protein YcaP (DUF421 family)